MKIKLDENLPAGLGHLLTNLGHDVDTVLDEGMAGQDDTVIFRAARDAGRFLITQDLDFSDARAFAPGTHHGILLVRLPQPGRTALSERVATLFGGEDVDSWSGCLVTATLRKVRVKWGGGMDRLRQAPSGKSLTVRLNLRKRARSGAVAALNSSG